MEDLKEKVPDLGEAGDNHSDPSSGARGGGYGGSIGRPQRSKTRAPLLQLGHDLGVLHDVHSRIFEFNFANSGDWQFTGTKGGTEWKGKITRYFIS